MKKVSFKMFFAVLWKGICQAFTWFFGLFGYKREGGFAKFIWHVFAVCAIAILVMWTCNMAMNMFERVYLYCIYNCGRGDYWEEYLSPTLTLRHYDDGVDVIDDRTEEVLLSQLEWVEEPLGDEDTLAVFSDGKHRGYFSVNTGRVVIEPRYTHAWVFCNGIASVEENGIVKFIDATGRQVFDRTFAYDPDHPGYVFHNGYCKVDTDGDGKYGLIDTNGEIFMAEEYDDIEADFSGIVVTMADNTMKRYDLDGNLVSNFCVRNCNYLTYDSEYDEVSWANLRVYQAGHYMCGLITEDGRVVTLPKYNHIEAVAYDLYMCSYDYDCYELVDGEGRVVDVK